MENTSAPTWAVVNLTPDDAPRVVEHYLQLSREELSLRFFSGIPESLDRRREWVQATVKSMFYRAGVRHQGIVDPADGQSLAAVSSWGASLRMPKTADFGVSVAPRWRGKGLTLALLDHACTEAVQAGMDTMRVDYRPDNSPVRALLQSVALVLPLGQGHSSAKLSLEPYAGEVRKVVESVAAFLEAVGMGPPGEARL